MTDKISVIVNNEMTEIEKKALFDRMKTISTPDGDYVIYTEGDKTSANIFATWYGVYLFIPTDNKDASLDTLFNGIDSILWDGSCFQYYKRINDPDAFHSIAGADKLAWMATDLLHLYMMIAEYGPNIHEDALQAFLQEIGEVK